MDDWRLTNQDKHLKNKILIIKDYKDRTASTDHNHCEFCYEKFSDDNQDINREGKL